MTAPFLITGCGRSGTGWAAALFTTLGYPCGHEAAFNPATRGSAEAAENLARPDSSWLAVPYAHRLPEGTPVIRVMRNPYAVVRSAVARGFLADMSGPYERYVQRHRPDITLAPDHLGRVIRWVGLWDEPLYDVDHYVLPIETGDAARAIEYATSEPLPGEVVQDALVLVGNSVNTNISPRRTTPSLGRILDHPDAVLLAQRARRFGYPD